MLVGRWAGGRRGLERTDSRTASAMDLFAAKGGGIGHDWTRLQEWKNGRRVEGFGGGVIGV